ncbi:hypothetical protein [Ornithinimicrobium kibberense]|uniref:hypothetical protein n=1 Tax=Ornithinimicrobium kibberense TaxID=282060 RepID=UPI003619BA80
MAAAPGCTCQNPRAETAYRSGPTCSCTVGAGPRGRRGVCGARRPPPPRRRPPPRPRAPSSPATRGTTTGSPTEGATTSSAATPRGAARSSTPVPTTPGAAMRQSLSGRTSWERCRRSPTPSGPTANSTRVRHRRPSSSPGTGSQTTSTSATPPSRASCSRTTAALSRRCSATSTCCRSHPPHRPGPA